MTIERITLTCDTKRGFNVGCLDCKSKDHQGVGFLFSTDLDNLMGLTLANNAAQLHEFLHPDHAVVIFDYERLQ